MSKRMMKQIIIGLAIGCAGIFDCIARQLRVPKHTLHHQIPLNTKQRVPSYPYITGDTFRDICHHIIDETHIPFDPNKLRDGDIIFVNARYLDFFFKKIQPLLRARYVLVTHNDVAHVPGTYAPYLDDTRLIAWFGKNAVVDHPKLFQIPIGIPNAYWPYGNTKILDEVRNNLDHYHKQHSLYVNFTLAHNKTERTQVMNQFQHAPWAYVCTEKPYKEYLEDLAQAYFVLSPAGTGLDCYRTWEALLVGCIPIVKSSALDSLYADLPVVIVDDWRQITQEFLEQQYRLMQQKEFNTQKLYMQMWRDYIVTCSQTKTAPQEYCAPLHEWAFMHLMEPYDHFNTKFAYKDKQWRLAAELYEKHMINEVLMQDMPRIPKIIHQIWLGSPLPNRCKELQATILRLHPDWAYMLWTEKEIEEFGLVNKEAYDVSTNYGQKSDIARYEILDRFGGVYLDCDFELIKSLDEFHHTLDFYVGCDYGKQFLIFNGLMGSTPGNPILKECIASLDITAQHSSKRHFNTIQWSTGPYHLTRCWYKQACNAGRCVVLPSVYFYPLPHYKRHNPTPDEIGKWITPDTYGIHYWHTSWQK